MTIRARYSGVCPDCDEKWQPGDLIRSRPVGAEHRETWHHAHCPDVPDPESLRPGETVCTDCWLVHPEGVECW